MPKMTDASFLKSLQALHDFADFRTKEKAGKSRLLLKLEWQKGERVLRAVPEAEMTFFDKVSNFFLFGGFRLATVVNFIQSKDFLEKFSVVHLSNEQKSDVQAAAHSLDLKIKRYNAKHFFGIHPKQGTLSRMLRAYFEVEPQRIEKKPPPTLPSLLAPTAAPALLNFEKELMEGIQHGKVVINKEGNIVGMPDSVLDTPIKEQLRNRAYILQELRRLSSLVSLKTYQPFCRQICKERKLDLPTKPQVAALQEKMLRKFPLQEVDDFARLVKLVEECKLRAALLACGISPEESETLATRWHHIDSTMERLEEVRSEVVEEISADRTLVELSPLAQRRLRGYARATTAEIMEGTFQELLTKQKEIDTKEFAEKLRKEIKKEDSKWTTRSQFYLKWHRSCSTEMIQGLKDFGEVLGEGICYALSLRWGVAERKGEPLLMGKTFSQDRYLQVFYKHGRQTKNAAAKIAKFLGIKELVTQKDLLVLSSSRELVAACIKNFIENASFQKEFDGVAAVSFYWKGAGHAISVCCREQETPPVFRFHDANFGTFSLSSRKELVDCLSDLLHNIYSKEIRGIDFTCFRM